MMVRWWRIDWLPTTRVIGVPARCATSGAVMGPAYPTPHRGSHKGVPLRVRCRIRSFAILVGGNAHPVLLMLFNEGIRFVYPDRQG